MRRTARAADDEFQSLARWHRRHILPNVFADRVGEMTFAFEAMRILSMLPQRLSSWAVRTSLAHQDSNEGELRSQFEINFSVGAKHSNVAPPGANALPQG